MNRENRDLASQIVNSDYISVSNDSRNRFEGKVKILLSQKRMPDMSWSDAEIQGFLSDVALMDTNNFDGNVGAGEREARIFSPLVKNRHFSLGHGIGRSGNIVENQPKAIGSSLIYTLTNSLLLDALRISGFDKHVTKSGIVLPLATGMSCMMAFLTLKQQRPGAKYIIWPRIDQKSCFKSIISAGFEPLIVKTIRNGDQISTDLNHLKSVIEKHPVETILCLFSTTSCFAPRSFDRVDEMGKLCLDFNIPHIINNAYGVQSQSCAKLISRCSFIGRVDAFIQSLDKNFMVPVGGSFVASPNKNFIVQLGKLYPGRASIAPALDIFITLLSLGKKNYVEYLKERISVFNYFQSCIEKLSLEYPIKLLNTPDNDISIGILLENLENNSTMIGSMMFHRLISGARVVDGSRKTQTSICGYEFKSFGSHIDEYAPYLTVAAAIGMKKDEVDQFIKIFEKILKSDSFKNVTSSALHVQS